MSTSNYLIWERAILPGACSLSGMTGFPQAWKLKDGESLPDGLPPSARFDMHPDRQDDVALTDSLYNINMVIVGSQRLRQFLEAKALPDVEFLEVPVFNHKGRLVEPPFSIVHPVNPVDCLDAQASEAEFDLIDSDVIDQVARLVIDESRIPADRLLLRPKGYYRVILVHRQLAAELDAVGMQGIRWVELSAWPQN
jgi:hypothetical protein